MTATEKLNALFHRWQVEFPDYQGKFTKDGINNEAVFNNQKLKLLFLAKEPNDPDQGGGDFREWWSEEVKYSFSHRICEWAFGLLNEFPPVEDLIAPPDWLPVPTQRSGHCDDMFQRSGPVVRRPEAGVRGGPCPWDDRTRSRESAWSQKRGQFRKPASRPCRGTV